jgi:arginine decarboxylase
MIGIIVRVTGRAAGLSSYEVISSLAVDGQHSAPLFDAVRKYMEGCFIPFHVPGHKQGRGLPELADYAGRRMLQMDLCSMDALDYANAPQGVIRDAEALFAQAFGADHALFLVNGTTSGVQTMIMSACGPGDVLILPRSAHRCAFGGLILSGAVPAYIQPVLHRPLGLALGVTVESVAQAVADNPGAKAVFVINPTYYGIASDLRAIVALCRKHGLACIVDEAHGAHLPFHEDFPVCAMAAGADMSAVSMHKTGGSLTQSSALLCRHGLIGSEKIRQVRELTFTSSASYLLMCSLDLARKQLAVHGRSLMERTLRLSRWARDRINTLGGLRAFGPSLVGSPGCHAFDETKLGINVSSLGLSGCTVETMLRHDHGIQVEMSDLANILAVITSGDRRVDLVRLVSALEEIARDSACSQNAWHVPMPEIPTVILTPRDAFYRPKKVVSFGNSAGEIAGEIVMAYPPGIPVICTGERITSGLIAYIRLLRLENCRLQGMADPSLETICVLK